MSASEARKVAMLVGLSRRYGLVDHSPFLIEEVSNGTLILASNDPECGLKIILPGITGPQLAEMMRQIRDSRRPERGLELVGRSATARR